MDKPLYGSVEILLYCGDLPGRSLDEQREEKEAAFERISLQIMKLLEFLALEEGWDWGVAPV